MNHFHHFISIVGHTLPFPITNSSEYWCKDVLNQALLYDWLMSGIMAISAYHLVTFSSADKMGYVSEARRMSSTFSGGLVASKARNG